jgi:hypothetical protein
MSNLLRKSKGTKEASETSRRRGSNETQYPAGEVRDPLPGPREATSAQREEFTMTRDVFLSGADGAGRALGAAQRKWSADIEIDGEVGEAAQSAASKKPSKKHDGKSGGNTKAKSPRGAKRKRSPAAGA